MRLKSRLRLTFVASLALSGAAFAQTPPADQPQAPAQAPGPVNPVDQSTSPNPPATAAEQTGVAGGPSSRKAATEEIVVTGSRVRRKDLTTPAPVTVINREQLQTSGIASIGDFLQQMPEQGGATSTNVNNGGDGETQISLRNLGASRTLVLVDGKRWVPGGSGAGTAVDLNSIPSAAIERVEVLKDGASAVYGSDAIGGVVNIITRRRVNGVEASAYYGTSQHGDAQQIDLNVTGGAASDKGSFTFSAGYFDQKAMFAANRDWAASALTYDYSLPAGDPNQVTTGGSPTIPRGKAAVNINACGGNPLCQKLHDTFGSALNCPATGKCTKQFVPDTTSPVCSAAPGADADLTACQVDGWRPFVQFGPHNDSFNFQSVNYLITPSTRMSLFSNGEYHISDSARAYFQGSFLNRQSAYQLAPEPLNSQSFGASLGADNVYNPFGNCGGACTGQAVNAGKRLLDAGGRSAGFDISTVRAVAGIDGTLPSDFGPLQGVFWDFSFNYGRTSGTTTYNGSVNTGVTAQALGHTIVDPSSPTGYGCATKAGAPIPGCVPANLFGTLTPAMLQSLGVYSGIDDGFTQLASAQANVSAELFNLASDRPIGLAAGYEYRSLFGGFNPDPIGAAGLSFDFNSLPTRGSYHVNEGYAELDVPIISHVAGAEDLEFQGAVRAYDYSTFGGGATYKLGLRWRPIRDVTLRGTYSTGFRAPGISDLYGGQQPSAEPAVDPCANAVVGTAIGDRCNAMASVQGAPAGSVAGNGDTSQQINSTVGGNPKLQPETAKIATVGVVLEPSMLRGLSATVDYYNILVDQNLGFITTPVIINGCYSGGNNAYCALITRDSNGVISNVSDLENNVGKVQTSGIDFAVRYTLPTDFGRFGFLFDSTYLIYYRQTLADGSVISAAGNYDLGSGSATSNLTPKIKFNVGVNYSEAGFSAGVRGRYIGGFDECAGSDGASDSAGLCSPDLRSPPVDANGDPVPGGTPYAPHHVSAYVAFDVFGSYLLKSPFGNTTFSVGVRNLLNTDPPRVYNAFLTYTDPAYDFAGRFVYGRITQNF
jgi:iron complex outermembrane receptor protein